MSNDSIYLYDKNNNNNNNNLQRHECIEHFKKTESRSHTQDDFCALSEITTRRYHQKLFAHIVPRTPSIYH